MADSSIGSGGNVTTTTASSAANSSVPLTTALLNNSTVATGDNVPEYTTAINSIEFANESDTTTGISATTTTVTTTTTLRTTTERVTVATAFYSPEYVEIGEMTEPPDTFTIPPFLLGIGGGAIVLLVIILAVLGLILRVNRKKRINKRRKFQNSEMDKPPYLDFRSPSIPPASTKTAEQTASTPSGGEENRISQRYVVPDVVQQPAQPGYPASGQYWASLEKSRYRSPRPLSMYEDSPALRIPRPRPTTDGLQRGQGSCIAKPKLGHPPYSPQYAGNQARYEKDYLSQEEVARIQNNRRMADRAAF